MQLWLGLIGLAGILGAPAIAGLFQLRAANREKTAKALDDKTVDVQSEVVDVYALLQASIIREAAEKAAHEKTKRQLAACRRARRQESKSKGR